MHTYHTVPYRKCAIETSHNFLRATKNGERMELVGGVWVSTSPHISSSPYVPS